MKALKNHPFAVEAIFDQSLVLTFAIPKAQLQSLIPARLALDTFENTWAFVAVAMVQTRALRPKGFPHFPGNDFFLIGYRVFVRYKTKNGKNLRGLYILKSETDSRKMTFAGNIFTHYQYTTTDIRQSAAAGLQTISSDGSDFSVTVETDADAASLPEGSPFTDWKDARKFSGPLPHTFTYDAEADAMLIIKGLRENWKPRPVKVVRHHFGFLDGEAFQNARLASAFEVRDVPYCWEKGVVEKW